MAKWKKRQTITKRELLLIIVIVVLGGFNIAQRVTYEEEFKENIINEQVIETLQNDPLGELGVRYAYYIAYDLLEKETRHYLSDKTEYYINENEDIYIFKPYEYRPLIWEFETKSQLLEAVDQYIWNVRRVEKTTYLTPKELINR